MSKNKPKEWTLVSFANLTKHGHLMSVIEAQGPELTGETRVIEYIAYEELKSELEATETVYRMNRQYVEDAKLKIKQLEEEVSNLRLGIYK